MKRNLEELTKYRFDLLIIGGGIYGATVAYEGALRGLKVALIDRYDFGSKTSSNSLKIVHGGLRYLQQMDIKRMRESIRERRIMMAIAPHLVHPIPCIMPTYGYLMKSKWVMRIGLLMNDLFSFDRNRIEDPEKKIPMGKVVSRDFCLTLCPGIDGSKVTGGASWTDGQMYNSERLTLAFILSASKEGAEVANYVKAIGFLRKKERITGIKAQDQISGDRFEMQADMVLNTSGGWINEILALLDQNQKKQIQLSTAMNLVINRSILPEYAAGLHSRFHYQSPEGKIYNGRRVLFMTPWRDCTIVGTFHKPYDGKPDDLSVTEQEIERCLKDVNRAYPGVLVERDDVSFFHKGFLPMDGIHQKTGEVILTKHYRIIDHHLDHGFDGLISVVGVKYTTARDVAERVIHLIFKKLDKQDRKNVSSQRPLVGGDISRFDEYLSEKLDRYANRLQQSTIKHLVYSYGSEYPQVIKFIRQNKELSDLIPGSKEVIKAEVIHAIEQEMAMKLSDVILRRTDLGSISKPTDSCLVSCSGIMAAKLRWNQQRIEREIREVKDYYRTMN